MMAEPMRLDANGKRPCRAQFRIAEAISREAKTHVDPFDVKLWSAVGYWAHIHQDCQKFTGTVEINGLPHPIGSWGLTVSDIRRGRAFYIEGPAYGSGIRGFQIEPKEDGAQG